MPSQVVAPSLADAWMIGTTTNSSDEVLGFADRWDSRAWKRLVLPRRMARLMAGDSGWSALSASTPWNVWLFGQTAAAEVGHTPETDVWLHYHHGRVSWGTVRLRGSAYAGYALATGNGGVWVFGYPDSPVVYAWHYQHGSWARHRLPGRTAQVVSAAASPGGDIWALESYQYYANNGTGGALLHYSAGRWKQVSLPTAMSGAPVTGVVPCGADCAWISGGTANRKGGTTEAIARWAGSRWYVTTPRVPASRGKLDFSGIVSDGRGGLWAAGYRSLPPSPSSGQLWHFAKNTWTKPTFGKRVEVGQPLALITGSASFWALDATPGTKRGPLPRTALALVIHSRTS